MDEDRYDRQRRIWGTEGEDRLKKATILIAGAGGIGSEIIKNLALLGIGSLLIVDMDLIELSNLNRQLLFRDNDIGCYKAEITAKRVRELNPEVKVEFFNEKLQNLPNQVFKDANIFVSALDNISARIFLNQKAVLYKKPLIDGGSEGFYGHVQVVLPQITPCLLCHDLWLKPEEKFKCSYAVNPRTPLDCVLEGRDKFFLKFNRLPSQENEEDLRTVYNFARAHAEKHNIIGVTYEIVKDSIKGTVAALITTNAIIGAVMTNELLKILMRNISINGQKLVPLTYFQFNGITELGWSIPLDRNESCPVCGIKQLKLEVHPTIPLIQFIQRLESELTFELQAPLLLKEGIIIYRDKAILEEKLLPKGEIKRLKKNELRPLQDFFDDGDNIYLRDEILGIELWIIIKFQNQDKDGQE
ncbi:MAG: ThiF family adenylyltransferase [Candidatus Helarchaeota archaeon]